MKIMTTNGIMDTEDPIYYKLAMELIYYFLMTRDESEPEPYMTAPDGKEITLTFATIALKEYADSL